MAKSKKSAVAGYDLKVIEIEKRGVKLAFQIEGEMVIEPVEDGGERIIGLQVGSNFPMEAVSFYK